MTLPSYANSETKPRCWVTLGLRPLCIEIGMEDWWVGNLVIIYKTTEDVCPINVTNKISFFICLYLARYEGCFICLRIIFYEGIKILIYFPSINPPYTLNALP